METELDQFLAPYAPAAVLRCVTTASSVDDRSTARFVQLVDDNAAALFDAILSLSQFDLFLLCEEKAEFFSWVQVPQRGGARVYFVRDDLDGGATLQAFLEKVVLESCQASNRPKPDAGYGSVNTKRKGTSTDIGWP